MASLKVLEKRMRTGFASGDFYAGEQACRTLYHRLSQPGRTGKPPTPQDLTRALDIVISGASELLSKNQFQAGSSLALLALKHLHDHMVDVQNNAMLDRVFSLCSGYAVTRELEGASEAWKEQLRVVKAALKWTSSKNCSGTQYGDARLNALAGHITKEIGDFHASQRFFIRSDEPAGMASMLHEWSTTCGLASEADLFVTRAILLYLLSENLGDANVVIGECRRMYGWPKSGSGDPSAAPALINFCELLLASCQFGHPAAELFTRLRSVYAVPLKEDQQLDTMVESIGSKYFGIQPPPPAGMAGMMQSMLRGMMTQNS